MFYSAAEVFLVKIIYTSSVFKQRIPQAGCKVWHLYLYPAAAAAAGM